MPFYGDTESCLGEEGTEKDHRMLFSEKGTHEEKSTFRGQNIKDFVSQMLASMGLCRIGVEELRKQLEIKVYCIYHLIKR